MNDYSPWVSISQMAWCRSQPEESTRTPHQSTETESGICYREQQAGSSVDKMSKLGFKSEQATKSRTTEKAGQRASSLHQNKSKKFLRTALLHAANDGGSETKRHQRTTTTKTCWLNPRQQCSEKGKAVHLGFTWQTETHKWRTCGNLGTQWKKHQVDLSWRRNRNLQHTQVLSLPLAPPFTQSR